MKTENNTPCHIAFEAWVKSKPPHPEIKWIGHSYANAYMAAQWEGFQEAYKGGKNMNRYKKLASELDQVKYDLQGLKRSNQLLKMRYEYSQAPWKLLSSEKPPAGIPILTIRLDQDYSPYEKFYENFIYDSMTETEIASGRMYENWLFAWKPVCVAHQPL